MALALQRGALAARAGVASARPARSLSVVVRAADGQINPSISKDVDKVVTSLPVAEIPKKAVFCRCWRSGKFPYCDGTHAKHNKETGDNVGPLIIEKAE